MDSVHSVPSAPYFSRLPDTGPLDIKDYRKFLEDSKIIFEERWNKVIVYKEVLTDFDLVKVLGNGSFGSVVLVNYHKNKKDYAMKITLKASIAKSKQINYLKNEKKVLQCVNFPFMVYLNCCFQDCNFVYLVMPYVECELHNLIQHLHKFGEGEARFYVSQIVLAIEYLHCMNLIYRDLKPENILIDATGYVKLTDFGFCKRMDSKRTFTLCGTPEYVAPEVLLGQGYGVSVDWWSCGVFVYEMVAGTTPFHAKTSVKIYSNILSGKYRVPRNFSAELKDLLENILTSDLTKRFGNLKNGADEIKFHKWFRTVNWMSILNRTASAPFQPPLPCKSSAHGFDSSILNSDVARQTQYCSQISEMFEHF